MTYKFWQRLFIKTFINVITVIPVIVVETAFYSVWTMRDSRNCIISSKYRYYKQTSWCVLRATATCHFPLITCGNEIRVSERNLLLNLLCNATRVCCQIIYTYSTTNLLLQSIWFAQNNTTYCILTQQHVHKVGSLKHDRILSDDLHLWNETIFILKISFHFTFVLQYPIFLSTFD